MDHRQDYERLDLLFRRATSLPVLPTTTAELIKAIDKGEATASQLERIIQSDPGLTAEFLRIAAVRLPGQTSPAYSSIRGAIMVLGFKAVKSLATSLMVRHLLRKNALVEEFDAARFVRHSTTVAFLARYLYSRKQKLEPFDSQWSADEVFALGLLSSLGLALLAFVAPPDYFRIHRFAERAKCSLGSAFQQIYGKPHELLCASAARTWGLADDFHKALSHIHEPWAYEEEYTVLSCVAYADYLAHRMSATMESWETEPEKPIEAEAEVGIPDEEFEILKSVLTPQVDDLVDALFSKAA
jgi:HD-like signal output (HDOD) protein